MVKKSSKALWMYLAWEDFGLVCRKQLHTSQNDTPAEHEHKDFYELVIVAGGTGVHRSGGRDATISAGNVFLIPPNSPHQYVEYHDLLIYNLLFNRKFIRYFLSDLTSLDGFQLIFNMKASEAARSPSDGIRIEEKRIPEIIRLLDTMDELNRSDEPGVKTLVLSHFIHVMLLLARHCRWSGPPKQLAHIGQLSQLMTVLAREYHRPWNLGKMARSVNMSVSAFRQEFRKLTGVPPMEYLLQLRLEHSVNLLGGPGGSLGEIAAACGFSSANYYSRQFKKYFGIAPSRYR
ncbi:MAG: AraC family transcriptional regulator [Lentisphaeria bacterium]|nr:AraC family transcriptional regulator [Lentisphaeria bacterium]